MNQQYKANANHVLHLAESFTTTAIQNNMISASTDPKETAKNVSEFYRTILETINED